jgi:hypothetical protein
MNNRQPTEYACFYFKIADTGETVTKQIPTNLCIANFIEYVKNLAYPHFNIDRNTRIEIVEAGQDIPNVRAEDAPAIQRDFNTTVRQRYNGVYENRAFYIRVLRNNNQRQLQNVTEQL